MSSKRPTRRRRKEPRRPLRVFWSERALDDLRAIDDFIAADDPVAAERWGLKLIEAVESAAAMPLAGRRVPERGRDDIREVLRRNYRIVYAVREDRIRQFLPETLP